MERTRQRRVDLEKRRAALGPLPFLELGDSLARRPFPRLQIG
jgi:hypothetical protein